MTTPRPRGARLSARSTGNPSRDPRGRPFTIDAASLGVGAGIGGIAIYGYAVIGSRALGAEAFAPVSVLWTFWAVAGAALAFPIQHWVIRRIHADGGEAGVRRALPRMSALILLLAVASGSAAWVERWDLFRRGDALFPVFLSVIVIGTAVMGLIRGGLATRGRFHATAAAIAGENVIRLLLAGVGAAMGWGVDAFALALLAGFGVAVIWPSALSFTPEGSHAAEGFGDGSHQLAFLGGISMGSLLAQFVLTGAPVAMALVGAAAADITSVFAALALFRAPYIVALGIASRITGALTSLVVGDQRARMRLALTVTVAGAVVAAGIGAVVGATVGGTVLMILFGPEVEVSTTTLVVLGAGSGVALGTLAEGLLLISRARWRSFLVTWAVSLTTGVAWIVAGPGQPPARAATGFLLAETVAFLIMLALEATVGRSLDDHEALPVGPILGG